MGYAAAHQNGDSMIDEATLGDLVRERRLAAGYSLGQLASKVGKTAAVVREWERGETYPETDLVQRLAETLEIDLGEIAALVPPEPEPEPDIVESPAKAPIGASIAAAEATTERAVVRGVSTDEVPQMDESADLMDFWAAIDVEVEESGVAEMPIDLTDAPTEAIFPPAGAAFFPEPRPESPAVVVPVPVTPVAQGPWDVWLAPLRAVFDPHRRWLYWIRAALTIAVFLVLFLVLAWAVKELFGAISEFLDSIEPADTADDVVSLVVGIGKAG